MFGKNSGDGPCKPLALCLAQCRGISVFLPTGSIALPKIPGFFPTQATQERQAISHMGTVYQDFSYSCLCLHTRPLPSPTRLTTLQPLVFAQVISAGHHQLSSQTWQPGFSGHQHCCPASLLCSPSCLPPVPGLSPITTPLPLVPAALSTALVR